MPAAGYRVSSAALWRLSGARATAGAERFPQRSGPASLVPGDSKRSRETRSRTRTSLSSEGGLVAVRGPYIAG